MLKMKSADLDGIGQGILPAGYRVVSMAHYPGGRSPITGKEIGYAFSLQAVHQDALKGPPRDDLVFRGTGDTIEDALEAIVLQIR
jgi:hypothetical protein